MDLGLSIKRIVNMGVKTSTLLFGLLFSMIGVADDEELYDFSRTIGLISFTADGKEFSLLSGNGDVDGTERGGVGLLVGPIQNYYYAMNQTLDPDADLAVTDEILFFSYDDELTLFVGDHWISDGIKIIEISPEDFQTIRKWRGINSRSPTDEKTREWVKKFKREQFGAELEAARKLKIQGYDIEDKFNEILEREERADRRSYTDKENGLNENNTKPKRENLGGNDSLQENIDHPERNDTAAGGVVEVDKALPVSDNDEVTVISETEFTFDERSENRLSGRRYYIYSFGSLVLLLVFVRIVKAGR